MKSKIITGERFGRLTVSKYHQKGHWECVCDCGNVTYVYTASLKNGYTKSCGCLRKEITSKRAKSHGLTHTDEYKILQNMKHRCYNKNNKRYPIYGGRGISVCERWRNSADAFVADMGVRPSKKHSIDRIDANGNYEPNNCRWATAAQQANNQRVRVDAVLYDGKNATYWALKLGISRTAAFQRIKRLGTIHLKKERNRD